MGLVPWCSCQWEGYAYFWELIQDSGRGGGVQKLSMLILVIIFTKLAMTNNLIIIIYFLEIMHVLNLC